MTSSIRTQRGVSLIELMIAMTLGLLVVGAMTTIFVNNSQSRRELDKAAQELENGRYAVQLLSDDISLAGFYGPLTTLAISPASTTANPCSTTLTEWRNSMDIAVEGVNSTNFACVTGSRPNTGMIFLQRASTVTTPKASLDATLAYLQVSMCGDEYTSGGDSQKLLDVGTNPFGLKEIDCGATVAPIRQYIRRIYFIDQNNVAGDGIPTLKRVDFASNQALGAPVALVEGIEDLHFEYGIDTDGDGSPDTFTETPAASDMPAILSVRVWVVARAIDRTTGYTDTKSYVLGTNDLIKSGVLTSSDLAYKRHVFSTNIQIEHPAARRAK